MWDAVIVNTLLFALFAIGFLRPKKKFEWRSMGIFLGFIVALFTEMYGIPLTIFLLISLFGENYPVLNPFSHPSGHLLLVFLGLVNSPFVLWLILILAYFRHLFLSCRYFQSLPNIKNSGEQEKRIESLFHLFWMGKKALSI